MDPVALAALIAQLVTSGIQVYNGIKAANPDTVPPLETILAGADADWTAVATAAQAQLNPPAAAPAA